MKAYLVLEGGHVFEGDSFGSAPNGKPCDVVFNTSMIGFTELITDPSSAGQALVLTYPLVGNCGVSFEDFMSARPQIGALIVSEFSEIESNFRSETSLQAVLERHNIPAVAGVDTRSLVRLLRGSGPVRGIISDSPALSPFPPSPPPAYSAERKDYTVDGALAAIAVPDTGMRLDLIRQLNTRGINVSLFPYGDPAVFEAHTDGWLLPDGPALPENTEFLLGILHSNRPVLATGLGHQLLALASGAKIKNHSPGHRGANIPVRDLASGKALITVQNHGTVVDSASVSSAVISHINVNDGSVEGLRWRDNIISVQFLPDDGIINSFAQMIGGHYA